MSWEPKEIFITQAARTSKNTACLYKDKHNYILVDYMEIDKYLDEGYKRTPMEFEESEEALIKVEKEPDEKDLKIKIDHLKEKIRSKEEDLKLNVKGTKERS